MVVNLKAYSCIQVGKAATGASWSRSARWVVLLWAGNSTHVRRPDSVVDRLAMSIRIQLNPQTLRPLLLSLQVLGTDSFYAYLNKYGLELDPQLEALVGRCAPCCRRLWIGGNAARSCEPGPARGTGWWAGAQATAVGCHSACFTLRTVAGKWLRCTADAGAGRQPWAPHAANAPANLQARACASPGPH